MTLAALIIATRETSGVAEAGFEERGTLIATLPLLGRTLIEHQVRQAMRGGARHVVLLVERMPAALLAAVDRLRREGLPIEVARAAADAADRFHPDETVLLIGDGVIAPQPLIARVVTTAAPAIATAGDAAGFERIDAQAWWAGLALIDGASVRTTVAMLGEWDAEATLVRRAVQAGATRIDAGPPPVQPVRIAAQPGLAGLAQRLARGAEGDMPTGWAARWLFAPAARALVPLIAGRRVEPIWLGIAAAAAATIGGLAAVGGAAWPGLALFLASGPLGVVAARLAAVRLTQVARARLLEQVRDAGALLLLGGIARAAATDGAVPGVAGMVALFVLLAILALRGERRLLTRLGVAAPMWIADADAIAWSVLPAALLGGWTAALAVATGYAAASFAVTQRLVGKALAV